MLKKINPNELDEFWFYMVLDAPSSHGVWTINDHGRQRVAETESAAEALLAAQQDLPIVGLEYIHIKLSYR